jgi:hypothetical protein
MSEGIFSKCSWLFVNSIIADEGSFLAVMTGFGSKRRSIMALELSVKESDRRIVGMIEQ